MVAVDSARLVFTGLHFALFLPFADTSKRGLGRLTAASLGSSIGSMFTGSNSRSGVVAQGAATGGEMGVFLLLTGGLLVRVQPEEPLFASFQASVGQIWDRSS